METTSEPTLSEIPELKPYFVTVSRKEVESRLQGMFSCWVFFSKKYNKKNTILGARKDAFFVRNSSSGSGLYALSFMDNERVRHCLIKRDSDGYFLQGDTDRFPSVVDVLRAFGFLKDTVIRPSLEYGSVAPLHSQNSSSIGGGSMKQRAQTHYVAMPQEKYSISSPTLNTISPQIYGGVATHSNHNCNRCFFYFFQNI